MRTPISATKMVICLTVNRTRGSRMVRSSRHWLGTLVDGSPDTVLRRPAGGKRLTAWPRPQVPIQDLVRLVPRQRAGKGMVARQAADPPVRGPTVLWMYCRQECRCECHKDQGLPHRELSRR